MTYIELSKIKTSGFNTNHVIDDIVNSARWGYTKTALKTAEVTESEMEKIKEAASREGVAFRESSHPIFRNSRFTERNYECTNIVACELLEDGAKAPDGYEAADDAFRAYVRNLTPLWIELNVRYYGYL